MENTRVLDVLGLSTWSEDASFIAAWIEKQLEKTRPQKTYS